MTGVEVGIRDWQPEKLPAHLQMKFAVYDADGKRIAEDTNLAVLQHRYADLARDQLQARRAPGSAPQRHCALGFRDAARIGAAAFGSPAAAAVSGTGRSAAERGDRAVREPYCCRCGHARRFAPAVYAEPECTGAAAA